MAVPAVAAAGEGGPGSSVIMSVGKQRYGYPLLNLFDTSVDPEAVASCTPKPILFRRTGQEGAATCCFPDPLYRELRGTALV